MSAVDAVLADPARPELISFSVPGEPAAWARAGGGKSVVRFTPAKQRNYMGAVRLFCSHAMRGAAPLDGPLRVEIEAVYGWPISWSPRKKADPRSKWKVSRPDIDNACLKLVADALNTVAFRDDAQIAVAHISKRYGDRPELKVLIEVLG